VSYDWSYVSDSQTSATLVGMSNLLGVIRLSRETDESTSPERQREQIQRMAELRGDTVVGWAIDLDVSGAVSPFERGELGAWLEKRAQDFDVICAAKMDRLTRSARHFDDLRQWCDDHSKTIVSVAESLDLSTPIGRMFAALLAIFAQFERERMSERRAEAGETLRQAARYGGGSIPYGYEAYQDGPTWRLRPSHDGMSEVYRMARSIIHGQSARQVAADLNARGVLTSRDALRQARGKPLVHNPWTAKTVIRVLRSETLLGYVLHYPADGGIPRKVFNTDNKPVQREAIIDRETWDQLQLALDSNSRQQSGNRAGASMLSKVGYCLNCQAPLWHAAYGELAYYRCAKASSEHKERYIPEVELETSVSNMILADWGCVQIPEMVMVRGNDHARAIAEVGRQIADLTTERFVRGVTRPDYDKLMTSLQAEHARISTLPNTPDRVERRPSSDTFAQRWPTLSQDAKRALMIDLGIKVYARREPDGFVTLVVEPGELLATLRKIGEA